MGKKLTTYEREERIVNKIVSRIRQIEKHYNSYLVERAAMRYKNQNAKKRSLLIKKDKLEEDLAEVNKDFEKAK